MLTVTEQGFYRATGCGFPTVGLTRLLAAVTPNACILPFQTLRALLPFRCLRPRPVVHREYPVGLSSSAVPARRAWRLPR
jgi:hypothetical protein